MPKRIQRKRTKGWKMPANTISCTRPGRFGNPFRVGGYFQIGKGGDGMAMMEALKAEYADSTFAHIVSVEQAIEMFREYRKRYPFRAEEIAALRAADYLACYCDVNRPCHVDVLLEIANA